ncbi:unnamed protein product [Meganyctiphanes norvegica]|uniref:Probable Ufm1-specific protease 2 n=1 Tax=Meganyctiphanes norvegica TaxID=48144 RepID=A0AAV2SG08_MEGNR
MQNKRLFLLSHLVERLKAQSSLVDGEVYGYVAGNGEVFVLSAAATTHTSEDLQHSPALLLPAPLLSIGTFSIFIGDHTKPNLQDGKIGLIWDQNELHVYSNSLEEVSLQTYEILSSEDMYEKFALARISFGLDLTSKADSTSIKNSIKHLSEQIASPAGCFHLNDTKLLLQNNDGGVLSLGGVVQDTDAPVKTLIKTVCKKKVTSNHETLSFNLVINRSIQESTQSPVVHIENNKAKIQCTHLNGDALVYIDKGLSLSKLANLLSNAVVHHLQLVQYWLLRQLKEEQLQSPLQSCNVFPYVSGIVVTLVYPENIQEDLLEGYRKQVHRTLLFPSDQPFVRRANKLQFPTQKKAGILQNTHIGLKPSGVNGKVSIVQGTYGYHHYMQDRFDDNKWGCAYRSLQTLISWFRYQGYTDKPIPTHREIQKCLVDIGDKPVKFIGSCQWIGSQEVGFVLDHLLGVSSKFIYVGSGADLAEKGRELALHFDTIGTPVMIGGGVLAHTIIGVHWNSETGDIAFLILDPHYTGGEDLSLIQKQGWCGWKGPDFWDANAYYNMCLPQPPKAI